MLVTEVNEDGKEQSSEIQKADQPKASLHADDALRRHALYEASNARIRRMKQITLRPDW